LYFEDEKNCQEEDKWENTTIINCYPAGRSVLKAILSENVLEAAGTAVL
jgi:hypothetical protein